MLLIFHPCTGKENNFAIAYGSKTFNTSYDFHSIMHYVWNAFAKDETKPTIEARNPKYKVPREKNRKLSDIDIQRINVLYSCPKQLPKAD